jgi:hypothetical protein
MQAGQPGLGKTTFVNNIRASFGQLHADVSLAPPLASQSPTTDTVSTTLHTVKCEDDKGNEVHYLLEVWDAIHVSPFRAAMKML